MDADLQTTCIQSLQNSFDIKEAIAQRCLEIFDQVDIVKKARLNIPEKTYC